MFVTNKINNYICSMTKMIQIDNGQRFGRYQVIERVANYDCRPHYKCKCDCGNERVVSGKYLRKGLSKSCGCFGAEQRKLASTKHGHSPRKGHSKEYTSWCNMKNRCYDVKNKQYADYGGRGIIVCDRWLNSFENFLQDMGIKPKKGYSLERIDNNGNYCPENCKWATPLEQGRNQRTNINVTYQGETKCIAEWAEKTGISYGKLHYRITNGKDISKCFE